MGGMGAVAATKTMIEELVKWMKMQISRRVVSSGCATKYLAVLLVMNVGFSRVQGV